MTRILVADNRVVIRAGLRALLQTRSDFFVCGEARDGREAIDLALQKKPDIVVINVNMPVVNGIEATRQIRQASPGTEVLIYTEENNDDLIREAVGAGARGYLLESAGDEEVIEAIVALAAHGEDASREHLPQARRSDSHPGRGITDLPGARPVRNPPGRGPMIREARTPYCEPPRSGSTLLSARTLVDDPVDVVGESNRRCRGHCHRRQQLL